MRERVATFTAVVGMLLVLLGKSRQPAPRYPSVAFDDLLTGFDAGISGKKRHTCCRWAKRRGRSREPTPRSRLFLLNIKETLSRRCRVRVPANLGVGLALHAALAPRCAEGLCPSGGADEVWSLHISDAPQLGPQRS